MSDRVRPNALFVDDDPNATELYAEYFARSANFTPMTALSAEEALTDLERSDVDCLVSDSVYTGDGDPLVEVVKSSYPELPVMLYSGREPSDLPTHAADGYLKKATASEETKPLNAPGESVHRLIAAADSGPGEESSEEWHCLGVFDWTETPDVSATVLSAFAEETGVDLAEAPPVFETIDPDALGALMAHRTTRDTSAEVSVQFPFEGYTIRISSDGSLQYR